MAKNIIFYFTGTGNSFKVAKDIAQALGECELVSMGKTYLLTETYENIGFVYPVYCGGLPGAVIEFAKNINLKENKDSYLFAVSTSGASGGGLPNLNKLLATNGGKLRYGKDVKCYANYVCLYGMENTVAEKAKKQDEATKVVIEEIKSKKSDLNFKNNIMSLAHGLFIGNSKKSDKNYNINSNCNGCGICSKVCPVSNIVMKDEKPTFKGNCEQCVACIQWCPQEAINYKSKTQNRGRYQHPDVKVEELFK